jgi:stage II sporulation protein AA (anti-sigma F factor antagonist)
MKELVESNEGWTGEIPSMEITEQKSSDVVTLRLSGRLNATTALAFEEKILGRIESGERHVVIDLAQLDYISSAGLRVIVLAGKRLSAENGKMVLCSLTDRVREVFDIAGLSSILSIYGSHDDATRGLQA